MLTMLKNNYMNMTTILRRGWAIIFISGFVIELLMNDVHTISMETLNLVKFGIIFWWIYVYAKRCIGIATKDVLPNFEIFLTRGLRSKLDDSEKIFIRMD